jgi:hypothetical protein
VTKSPGENSQAIEAATGVIPEALAAATGVIPEALAAVLGDRRQLARDIKAFGEPACGESCF